MTPSPEILSLAHNRQSFTRGHINNPNVLEYNKVSLIVLFARTFFIAAWLLVAQYIGFTIRLSLSWQLSCQLGALDKLGTVLYLWLSKASASERWHYVCNVVCHWLKCCSSTDRNVPRFEQNGFYRMPMPRRKVSLTGDMIWARLSWSHIFKIIFSYLYCLIFTILIFKTKLILITVTVSIQRLEI